MEVRNGCLRKTNNDNGGFVLLLHKLSFYNKWNAILLCKIKNFILFPFFFPGGWISNCHNKSLLLTIDAMKELRRHLSFTQLRFHCRKNKGRTLHLTTAANSSGEAVVQYFSGQTDANPKACGSFVRMKDENSKLAADCNQWGSKEWGYPHSGKSRYRLVAFVPWKYIWNFYGNSRWECDDYSFNDAEYFGLSASDFWRVFVR